MGFFENGLEIGFEGVTFGKRVDHVAHMVEPFRAVAAFIPVLHFPDCLPDFRMKQDGFVDHDPDSGRSFWEKAPELVFEMAIVKTNDAEGAVCRLPAAHERFFNELLNEGHGAFPSLLVVGRMQV